MVFLLWPNSYLVTIVLSKVNDKGIMNNFRRGKMAYSVDLRDYL